MSTLNKVGGALLAALSFSLLAAVTFAEQPAAAAGLRCTVSSGLSPTGREWGEIDYSPQDPSICLRRRVGGFAPADYPSCHQRGRNELGCTTVITVN